jgi:signal transduction histidine kinase
MFAVACTFDGGRGDQAVSGAAATHLYRIAQEATHNAVRHGRAKAIRVDLIAAADRTVLTVEDDGVGIPDERPAGGLGLHTMGFRARMIGAVLTVERGGAGGTVVTCAVRRPGPELATLHPNGDDDDHAEQP